MIIKDVKQCILLNQVHVIGGDVGGVCVSDHGVHAGMAFNTISRSCKLLGTTAASAASQYSMPAIGYTVWTPHSVVGQSLQALMETQGQDWCACGASACLEVSGLRSVHSLRNLLGDVQPCWLTLTQPCIFRQRKTLCHHPEYLRPHHVKKVVNEAMNE